MFLFLLINHENLTPELPCSLTTSSTTPQKVDLTKARPMLLLWEQMSCIQRIEDKEFQ